MSDPTEPTEKKAPAKKAPAEGSKAPASGSGERSTAGKAAAAKKTSAAKGTSVAEKSRGRGAGKGAGKEKTGKGLGGRLGRSRDDAFGDPTRGPVLTPRWILALLLMVGGIAWTAFYYVAVRVDPFDLDATPSGPGFMQDLGDWNYAIGFGAILLGLVVSAHKSTPLGRGRGVVVGMLGCFGVGLVWICVFYVISGADYYPDVPVFNDLDQKNLIVGIAFMAVGFTFATKWE